MKTMSSGSSIAKYVWVLLCINILVNEVVSAAPPYLDYENSIRDLYDILMQKEAIEERLGLHQVSRKSSRSPSLRLRFGRRSSGPPVLTVNFIVSQIVAVFLSTLFRNVLHPQKAGPDLRHLFGLTVGLGIGYFCFGREAIHLVALPSICYLIIRTQNADVLQGTVLITALAYLSVLHVHRQVYNYNSYTLDVTGPLMVITQKVTGLAFNIHDGCSNKETERTKSEQKYSIKYVPSPLEYFSYMLQFPTLLAGPFMFYNEYMEFVNGNAYKAIEINGNANVVQNGSNTNISHVIEPSPLRAVSKKVFLSVIYATAYIKLAAAYPIRTLKEEYFVKHTSLAYKFWYLGVVTTAARFKYYIAWTLSDASCNNAGIGFDGYDTNWNSKWNKFSNIDFFKFEFSTNMRESVEAWNIGTNRWLRFIVYERVKQYPTILTYTLSAIWHGFYPGYYLTFAGGALFTVAARSVRRSVRKYFTESRASKIFYDSLTFLCTRVVMAYVTFSFLLLEFWASVRIYTEMYWCLHILAILAYIVVPRLVQ